MIYISPDGTGDGSSESTPSNWVAAFENINEGGTILLLPGNYLNIYSQTINKAVTIKGFDDGVVFDGENERHFFTVTVDNVVFDNIKFQNGFNQGTGGAISSTKVTKILNCTFENNNAKNDGGAVFLSGENSVIANCTFYRNYITLNTQVYGGAVRVGNRVNITDCIFDSNYCYSATGDGADAGALAVEGSYAFIDNCLFNNNYVYGTSGNEGGVMRLGSSSIIQNSNFTNNRATWDGAVSVRGSSNSIINCNFINNTANEDNMGSNGGGALHIQSSSNSIINCTFINNTAKTKEGGAIYASSGTHSLKVFNCSFINNIAGASGGAVYLGTMDSVKINNLTLINNW